MKSLVDKVVEVLEPFHNGGEQLSATARKVIDVVLNHECLKFSAGGVVDESRCRGGGR